MLSRALRLYLSIPIQHCAEGHFIEVELTKLGYEVLNPCKIVPPDIQKDRFPTLIAEECYRKIRDSEGVVLFADHYGRDCACEIGYALAIGKPIFPLSLTSKPSQYLENDWMIKPKVRTLCLGIEELTRELLEYYSADSK